jgi:cytoskeletal protein CcmA (bactofilin family)
MWNWKEPSEEKESSYAKPSKPDQPSSGSPLHDANSEQRRKPMGQTAIIGQSIHIKGELTGNEDLTIEGTIEGKIDLKEHHLTIGQHGKIKADLHAKTITILGEVFGNAVAEEKVEIKETGKLRGDILSPRIAIADGAHFKGSVDMERTPAQLKEKSLREESLPPRPSTPRVTVPV